MQKVRLGKSQMQVTKIGFGGIPIQRLNEQDAIKVIRRAIDLGVNWIDTANGYSNSEERVGKAIKPYDRSAVKIFSKAGGQTVEELRSRIELSFERMQIDYIDLYQFHGVNSKEAWDKILANGCLDLVREMKQKGRIRHIGASAHTQNAVLKAMDHPEIEVIQWPFNFIVKDDAAKILKKCKTNDIGFIAMKPFAGGVLENAAACIRFLLQYPDVAADPGFEKIREVEEVVRLAEEPASLSRQDKNLIARLRSELGKTFCRYCGYCCPCPEGVSIITVMIMDSLIKRCPASEILDPDGWIAKGAKTIESCTECGQCEEKCPYKLSIREQIQEGARLFEHFKREAESAAKD